MRSALAIGIAQGRSKPLNAARLVNLYAEKTPEGSLTKYVLYGTPGLKPYLTVGTGKIRAGRFERGGFTYILSGAELYQVAGNGTKVLCTGASLPGTGRAMMTDNGVQLGLLIGSALYSISGTAITLVNDIDYPVAGVSSLDYCDGYGVLTDAGNAGQWLITGLYDFTSIDPLDFATAESSPDGLLRVLVNHREVWLFGTKTVEVWVNTGASPFPFERIPGSLLERGTIAGLSPVSMDNSVFWLGDDRIVYRASGYQPVRVSTFEVEEILRGGDVSDAEGRAYSQGGHSFYVLSLPSKGRTLVLDAATKLWHERQSGTTTTPAVWGVNCLFVANNRVLAGGEAGAVYEVDLDTYVDGTSPIRRSLTSMPVYPDGKRALMRMIELECELGVGATTGQGSAPLAMLRFSKDGGQTFGNEKTASIGPIGSRRARATWDNLGMFRNGAAEISFSDPVKIAIYGAHYEPEGLLV